MALKGSDGEFAKNPKTNAVAFSIHEAVAFLKDVPDPLDAAHQNNHGKNGGRER